MQSKQIKFNTVSQKKCPILCWIRRTPALHLLHDNNNYCAGYALQVLKAIREPVLLFIAFGIAAAFALFGWAKGSNVYRNKPYSFHVTFPEAEGIEKGVALR
jgi:hypothetical protein